MTKLNLFKATVAYALAGAAFGCAAAPRQTSLKVVHIVGNSMRPTLNPGEYWHVEYRTWDRVNVGDVAVFEDFTSQSGLVVHTIVSKDGNHAITKGDNNPFVDRGYITPEILLGIVTTKITNK